MVPTLGWYPESAGSNPELFAVRNALCGDFELAQSITGSIPRRGGVLHGFLQAPESSQVGFSDGEVGHPPTWSRTLVRIPSCNFDHLQRLRLPLVLTATLTRCRCKEKFRRYGAGERIANIRESNSKNHPTQARQDTRHLAIVD